MAKVKRYTVNTFARWVGLGEWVAYYEVVHDNGKKIRKACECTSKTMARRIAAALNKSSSSKEKP